MKPSGPIDAKIYIVGEAPDAESLANGTPFSGRTSGRTLDRILNKAGIPRNLCRMSNIAQVVPPAGKIEFFFEDPQCTKPKPMLQIWLNELAEDIKRVNPNIIIALGAHALWGLTGESGLLKHRGSVTPCSLASGFKVLPTWHPQAANWEASPEQTEFGAEDQDKGKHIEFTMTMDLKKAKYHANFKEIPADNRLIITKPTLAQWEEYCLMLMEKRLPVVCDVETVSPGSHIDILGLAHSKSFAMSMPVLEHRQPTMPESDEMRFWKITGAMLEVCPLIFHNAPYDSSVLLKNYGIKIRDFHMDTQIAAHVLYPELELNLAYLSSLFLDVPAWKHTINLQRVDYNAYDCLNTFGLYEYLFKELKRANLLDVFNYEMDQIEPASYMMLRGIDIDLKKKEEMFDLFQKKLASSKVELANLAGADFNYNSPDQVKNLLYIKLGLPPQFKRRKSRFEAQKLTTEDDALARLERTTKHPIVKLIRECKALATLINRYLKFECSPDGRVFTSYNITGTTSGRWSSSKSIIDPYGPGNLQNEPEKVRSFFVPIQKHLNMPPGDPDEIVFGRADYVQAEAVVVSYLCCDQILMKMFKDSFGMPGSERKKSYDVHKYTASTMFGIPVAQITGEQRQVGKTLRHAGNYKMGPQVVANKLKTDAQTAKKLLTLYYDKSPLLQLWWKRIETELADTRTLYNLFGRRRIFMGRWDDSLFRSAYSFPPQSTVGDMMNKAVSVLYHDYSYLNILDISMQLHDAIYWRCRRRDFFETCKVVRSVMLTPLRVGQEEMIVDVDFAIGDTWGTMQELNIDWRIGDGEIVT